MSRDPHRALVARAHEFIDLLGVLSILPTKPRYRSLALDEYLFDAELLTLSSVYRTSRSAYLELGGRFALGNQSLFRALSGADLFSDEICYAPVRSELLWLREHHRLLTPEQLVAEVEGVQYFNRISLFHEQNHRVVWRLLGPVPPDRSSVCRYLNFAESLVVTLDIAAADEIGPLAREFQQMSLLYRGLRAPPKGLSKRQRRQYLLAVFYTTYCLIERIDRSDVSKAVSYVLSNEPSLNRAAVRRALEINPEFTAQTNPRWQAIHWQTAAARLAELHHGSKRPALALPEDPLDVQPAQLALVQKALVAYGL